MSTQVLLDAELVYNYHRLNMPLHPADAIFCLCSLDTRIAAYAATLFLQHLAPLLIFSGRSGKLTAHLFGDRTEADVFASIAVAMGVPRASILIEPRATNTGENVRFTRDLLRERNLQPKSFILVQKPYMERRTYATFMKQWGDGPEEGSFCVTSPPLGFAEYPDEENPRDLVISIMVGDLVRIKEYPQRGFQIAQEVPGHVWDAGQRLIKAGYDGHLPV